MRTLANSWMGGVYALRTCGERMWSIHRALKPIGVHLATHTHLLSGMRLVVEGSALSWCLRLHPWGTSLPSTYSLVPSLA